MKVLAGTLVAVAILAGCSRGDNGQPDIVNTIVITRDDGSKLRVDGPVRVVCERLGGDGPRAVHVMVGERVPSAPRSFWEAAIAPRQLANKHTFTFPQDDVGGYAILFAFDAERGRNELSSSTEEATGRATYRKADCRTGIDFEVHAHLDSEFFEEPGVNVSGHFVAPASNP
jgi:hypothetical protein